MADVYWGIDRGEDRTKVARSSSTTSADFEFVVDDTNKPTRAEAIDALEKIREEILKGEWSLNV
jgi:hypothetical protein